MLIQLVDRNEGMVDAWTSEFFDCEDVIIYHDDFFAPQTDCIVSPANSFGFMDGGLDGVITKRLGRQTQDNVQYRIELRPMKELLVGEAILVETGNDDIPWCISAPTMRVPATIIEGTNNVYLASKAIFLELKYLKKTEDWINGIKLKTVTISGLGTGVGQVPFEICAQQMKKAYNEVWLNI
jgi:O-acetyl-ADP-ribose deacetylase (regulator of RNase III)|tara:strand:- start:32437 stop:32982 length:546 start_codon:yes stop_codon:yes gene_type:complete